MTREELHDHVKYSSGNEKQICQIYAIRDGVTVYEDNWRRYQTDSAVQVMSVTKGVMAVLTGIAVDKGYIQSTDQKVLEFWNSSRTTGLSGERRRYTM